MHLLARLSLRNRALIVLVCVFVCAFGAISMTQLKQELIPSVEFPQITVSASNAGASPEVMDKQVGQPLETAMQGVEGLDSSTATSTTGSTTVNLTFAYGTDLDRARGQVDRAISTVQPSLPDGVQPTSFAGSIADFPVVFYAVSGKDSLAATADTLEADVVPVLQKLEGVRQVEVTGAASQYVRVLPDEDKLTKAGLSPADVQSAIQNAGGAMPLGQLEDGGLTLPIQTNGALGNVKDIEALPLVSKKTGSTELLKDVASVKLADEESTSITRTNGDETLALSITKKLDADTVRVSEEVHKALPALQDQSGATFTLVFDQAPSITDSIHDLTVEGLLGLLFAIIVILIFLMSLRSTLVTAISIPLSLLVTFIGVWAFGFSLNMLTLGALTISIGRVVDDSIVVIENIKRHLAYAGPRGTAILDAVKEVSGAITASTLTTVAVFLPVAFVGGLAGELFRPFSLTVTVALIASLFVSLTIVPVLAYWFLGGTAARQARKAAKKAAKQAAKRGGSATATAAGTAGASAENAALAAGSPAPVSSAGPVSASAAARAEAEQAEEKSWLQRMYVPVLRGTQHHPVITLVASVLILVATFGMSFMLKFNLLGSTGQTSFSATLQMPAGTSLDRTDTAAEKVEKALKDINGVQDIQVTIGSGYTGFAALTGASGADKATFTVTTAKGEDVTAIVDASRAEVKKVNTGGEVEVSATQGGGFSSDITINVKASNPDTLAKADKQVRDTMEGIPDATAVESDLSSTQPQVQVTVDREKAAKAGLSQAQIAGLVNATLNPLPAGKVTFGFSTLDVKVGEGKSLSGLDDLKDLEITTATGPVPLEDFAKISRVDSESSITTQDTDRISTVTITPTETGLGAVSAVVTQRLADLDLPDGATATLGGAATQQADSFQQLGLALLAAIAIVYVIMVATFKSLVQPLILLVSIPFAATGSIGLLIVTGVPLGLASLIGMLMLVGIVVTNAIVLIDLINQYRRPTAQRPAMSLDDAIMMGARRRLRPILMTALATIFAMVPMALGLTGSGGFISQPLAVVVVGGLISSTLLTLILVPVLYHLVEGRREKKRVNGTGPEPDGLDDVSLGLVPADSVGARGSDAATQTGQATQDGGNGAGAQLVSEPWTGTIDVVTGEPRASRGRHAANPPAEGSPA
ncbi:efflux RND transporter permease subunit [Galactobacter caseinivorans]|uniref:AcrB/AcrD/AcrF family protein n=1 Tax=Galactobacter caseinivorans TaxID=2676123 RepID=A0A496PN03_9MICC|nr:efflux RND transporter permease subunit [Galactobacter caseinivorans]RKW71897.1 AcrB/AcrD/AcrF family protein [Galactobacter caseinivorans]